ncbi:hypothetical protein FRC01_008993, partial [Tulasnella sp. 417]
MHAQELTDGSSDELNIEAFVDMDPSTICTLVECGEINKGQLLALIKLCDKTAVHAIATTIDDTVLEDLLTGSDGFQPLLDVLVGTLGEGDLKIRAKRWLVNASKAQAKNKIVQCSRILQAIHSQKSSPTPPVPPPSMSDRLTLPTRGAEVPTTLHPSATPRPTHMISQPDVRAQSPTLRAPAEQSRPPQNRPSSTPVATASQAPATPAHRVLPTAEPILLSAQTQPKDVSNPPRAPSPKSPSPRKQRAVGAPPSAFLEPRMASMHEQKPPQAPTSYQYNSKPIISPNRSEIPASPKAIALAHPLSPETRDSPSPGYPEFDPPATVPPIEELLESKGPEDLIGEQDADADTDADEPANREPLAPIVSGNPWTAAANDDR